MAGGSKKRDRRAELDAAYRRALGLPSEAPLPKSLGSGESAGGARGGRGAAGRGKGRRK